MIRTFKYKAFPPKEGVDAFETAVALKRAMWADLCAMHADLKARMDPLFKVPKAERDADAIAALKRERMEKIKAIRQGYAEQGLAWGDYNAVIFQFDGACQSAARRNSLPTSKDKDLGEAVVRQIMGETRPWHLHTRNDVSVEYVPHRSHRVVRDGSHRSGYRIGRMSFLVRTDRNILGEAALVLEYVQHRPLPKDARVVEVRILRRGRKLVNKDGIVREIPEWFVAFVCKLPARDVPSDRTVGVALTWAGADEDGSILAVTVGPHGMRTVGYNGQHIAEWEAYRAMRDQAEEENDEALRVEAEIRSRKLFAARKLYLRTLAKEVVSGAGAVAVDDTFLSGKGVKNFTAPAIFRMELQRAAENAGCRFFREKIKEKDARKRASLLKNLAAEKLLSSLEQEVAA